MLVAVLPENAELPDRIPQRTRCYPPWTLQAPEPPLLALLEGPIVDLVARNGYLAIFLLMAVSAACVPIPSEVTMVFAGALASAAVLAPELRLSLVPVIAWGTAGTLAGSWVAYGVGYLGGRPLVDRFGRYLLLRPHEVDRADAWFARHGAATVLFGRMIPVIRSFISLPAGVGRMGFVRFTAYTVLGTLPWCAALAVLGYALGDRWRGVERVVGPFAWAIGGAAVLALAWWAWRRLRGRRADAAADRISPSGTPDA